MKDYKRLTKWGINKFSQKPEADLKDKHSEPIVAITRLAELEDKIESGQIVELPYAPDRIEVGETRIVRSALDDSVEFQTLIYIALKKDSWKEAMIMIEELEQSGSQIDDNTGAGIFRLNTITGPLKDNNKYRTEVVKRDENGKTN